MTDDRCRLTSQELFKPNTPYAAERKPDGRVVLTELVPAQVPTVRPRRVNGRLRGANVPLNRETVAAAVRAQRDER
jgi:hypothetical protein